ncbi:MAG: hypothetical protein HY909_21170, partial [Deltaproteobacteria bacterium]|nr:hypothetical protein [Deltaproteobacteria bacterium]
EQPGNTDPNAGFLRSAAVFAILVLSDEEDGSVRDCRFAERDPQGRPAPCRDATSVFDTASPDWASPDLNLRFYLYREGSPEDPTWPLDRYIDLADPNRGYLSTKPAHPELVVFGAIAGVPLSPPRTLAGGVDYDALLGRDGMGGFTGMSPEGPVSMRHANMDPLCTQRVVPACFREGSHYEPRACDLAAQYFAWPSRRLAEVARRFGPNGVLGSICASSYAEPLGQLAEAIQRRLDGRCLPRALPTAPPLCPSTPAAGCAAAGTVVRVPCTVRELLPGTVRASEWCTAARGRIPAGRDPASGREACVVTQLPAPLGGEPPAGAHGFFYDTRPDPASPECRQRVSFTPGDAPPDGATARIVCTP